MKTHTCTVCKSPHRQVIEDWRLKNHLGYERIIERAKRELDLKLSLGTLSRHFQYLANEIAEVVEGQMREFVSGNVTAASDVPKHNIELADRIIAQQLLTDEGLLKVGMGNGDLLLDLMKERRQSAEVVLRYTPASPESKVADALATWGDLVKAALKGDDVE